MIYNPEIGIIIQHNVKKKRPVLMLMLEEVKRGCPMYNEQTNLQGVYSWNRAWSLKSLVILKSESKTSLHEVQYK